MNLNQEIKLPSFKEIKEKLAALGKGNFLPPALKKYFKRKSKAIVSVYIDRNYRRIILCDKKGDRVSRSFPGFPFEESFYVVLQRTLQEYARNHPSKKAIPVNFILPDSVIMTDVITLPTMKKQMQTSLNAEMDGLYVNRDQLAVVVNKLSENKETTSFGISAVKADLLNRLYSACANANMTATDVTFASNARLAAAQTLSSHLRNSTYVFADVGKYFTTLLFVIGGTLAGFYQMDFGYRLLEHESVVTDGMIVHHPRIEEYIAASKKRVKLRERLASGTATEEEREAAIKAEEEFRAEEEASRLAAERAAEGIPLSDTPLVEEGAPTEAPTETPAEAPAESPAETPVEEVSEEGVLPEGDRNELSEEAAPALPEEDGEQSGDREETPSPSEEDGDEPSETCDMDAVYEERFLRNLARRPKRTPKILLRPVPTDPQEIAYENFRPILKWILLFIEENHPLTAVATPDTVYMNLPKQYDFLYDMINVEEHENKIKFLPVDYHEDRAEWYRDLAEQGGFCLNQLTGELF